MHHLKRLANRILPLGSRRRELARKVYRRASGIPSPASQASYHQWMERVEPTTVSPLARDGFRPLISIIVPAYNTPDKYLNPLVDSILAQTYDKWELVLVDASPDPERAAAIHVAAQQDKRIRLIM